MTDLEQRLAALEARTAAAEDELAIIRLIASYGPLVDTGRDDLAPPLFAADGVYDISFGPLPGPDGIAALLRQPEHQAAVATGIAHVMGLPWVRITGDTAIATNCTQVFLRDGEGYSIYRIAQNVWHLARQQGGWKIVKRSNRLIGSDDEARALLEGAI